MFDATGRLGTEAELHFVLLRSSFAMLLDVVCRQIEPLACSEPIDAGRPSHFFCQCRCGVCV